MTDAAEVSEPMILLVVGGEGASPLPLPLPLPRGSIVVAADSGLDRLAGVLHVDHLVGDLDSASEAGVRHAQAHGAEVHRFPADKDATDIELALDLVVGTLVAESGLRTLLVVGGGGGRLDHLLADVLLLTSPALAALDVTARFGDATITVVRPGVGRRLAGLDHEQVSLLPLHGPVEGVVTEGLRWPLVDAYLRAGTTRAMSNELLGPTASVRIDAGVLAVLQPGTLAAPVNPRATPYDPSPRPPSGGPSWIA